MIKVGSHRVSPKDIEETLLKHSGIQEVAVIGVPDFSFGEIICALIVPNRINSNLPDSLTETELV